LRKGEGSVSSSNHLTIDGRQILLQPIALGAKVVDLVEHSVEQRLGRGGRYAGALQLPDLTALPLNLVPHALYLFPNELDVWHARPSAMKGRH
jgi:hypothetical protein